MNDTDKLRPEVSDALMELTVLARAHCREQFAEIIRAELLRLTKENGGLRSVAGTIDTIGQRRARACEDELAALKAKVADSAHVEVTLGCAIDGGIPPDLALCKVALVKVEE